MQHVDAKTNYIDELWDKKRKYSSTWIVYLSIGNDKETFGHISFIPNGQGIISSMYLLCFHPWGSRKFLWKETLMDSAFSKIAAKNFHFQLLWRLKALAWDTIMYVYDTNLPVNTIV